MNWCFPAWKSKNLRNPQGTYSHRKQMPFTQYVYVYLEVILPWVMAKGSYFILFTVKCIVSQKPFRNVLHSQICCAVCLADEHFKCMQTLTDKLLSVICLPEDKAKWQHIIYCHLIVLKTTASVALHLTRNIFLVLCFVHLAQKPNTV